MNTVTTHQWKHLLILYLIVLAAIVSLYFLVPFFHALLFILGIIVSVGLGFLICRLDYDYEISSFRQIRHERMSRITK